MNIKDISKMTLLAAAISGSPAVFAANSGDSASPGYEANATETSMQRDGNIEAGDNGLAGSSAETSNSNLNDPQAETLANAEQNARAGTHVQILKFERDAVTLNDNAQTRLDNLAQTLEKNTPTNVVVKIEREGANQFGAGSSPDNQNASSSDENLADSSGSNQTVGSAGADYNSRDAGGDDQLNQEIAENQRLISEHRAERVRQFLEDRDVQVSQFDVTHSAGENPAIEQARTEGEDSQDVLIVISEESDRSGLSVR